MKANILIVENERIIAYDIKNCLENSGYNVIGIVAYGEQAIEKVAELHPDLILMDMMLKGDMNGIEAAAEIVAHFNIPVVYLTACSDASNLQKAKTTQPFGYILKPFEETQLITTIEIALNRHQTEVVMREALEKEKQERKIKSQFVSMVSHEFRNPLSNIFNYTELLSTYSHQLTEATKDEYIHHIQKSVKYLDNLLTDVLLIGKAEIGKYQFNPTPMDLEKFCKDLVSDIQFSSKENHNIIFTVQGNRNILEDTNMSQNSQVLTKTNTLHCLDEKLLHHILNNLLGNAIKYSPEGGTVRFDLFFVQEEVIFRIQDNGIGIPEADQEELFSSFQRGGNVGKIPGNGLGLAIVKQYVDLHNGEINFASKVGVGTTFIVSLPVHNH